MHELSIVEGMMRTVIPAAEKAGAKRILSITLKVGDMSGVIPSCVEEYFSLVSPGTMAEGAKLVMEPVPVTISCPACGYAGPVKRGQWKCPQCAGTAYSVTGGNDFFVDSLEAE